MFLTKPFLCVKVSSRKAYKKTGRDLGVSESVDIFEPTCDHVFLSESGQVWVGFGEDEVAFLYHTLPARRLQLVCRLSLAGWLICIWREGESHSSILIARDGLLK